MPDATIIFILFITLVAVFIAFWLGHKWGAFKKHNEWENVLMPIHRKDAIMRSRAVLGGHFSENLAPFLPNFKWKPNECSFLGKPIDFIVFMGSDEKNIDEVVFVEVKSGKARLNSQERKLKETIEAKRVRWEEYRIPEEITKKGDIEDRIDGEI